MHDMFIKTILSGRINHAWLIVGPRQQAEAEAIAFAQALLCLRPVNGQACGECAACRKVANGNHVDLQILAPAKNKTTVTIEQTRAMQQLAALRSYEGGRQVVIIQQADLLQKAAANSLLKVLEEPPADLVFLLTAQNGESLLPTIVSRCAIVKLEAGTETQSQEIAQQAADFLDRLPELPAYQLLLFAEQLREDKEGLRQFLEQLELLCRDGAVRQWGEGAKLPVLGMVQPQRFPFHGEDMLTAARLVAEAREQLYQNINTKLLLDVLLLNLGDLAAKGC